MIILLSGPSHAGKTLLAQRLLERYRFPALSIDHLKMGLIRGGLCPLTPESPDDELTRFLWPVVREMIKTAVENRQNLIVEGCYIPYDWRSGFSPEYLAEIKALWLIFSPDYIRSQFQQITAHANDIEQRLDDSRLTPEALMADHAQALAQCQAHGCPYALIDTRYPQTTSEWEEFLC